MKINRKSPPAIKPISKLEAPLPAAHQLDNGVALYEIHGGTQEVIKLEIVFDAGRPFEHKPLAARATARLLSEGTRHHSARQIAEQLDFYGGSLQNPINLDTSNIVLYCLSKHLDQLLPLVAEMICEPTFPAQELHSFVKRNKQRLQIDLAKNDVLAYRQITEQFFGSSHPYGYNSVPATYEALTEEDLFTHFKSNYHNRTCQLFLSGKTRPQHIKRINELIGQQLAQGEAGAPHLPAIAQKAQHTLTARPDSVQTAIRIGRRLFSRRHEDYHGMYVLNTVLGGYFGSRLMTNIRERKGYTYNIFSTLESMRYDGCFYVGTEVSNEFVADSLRQIYHELEVLAEDLIPRAELEMVRSYLLGNLLTLLDGPFNAVDITKAIATEGLQQDHFERLVDCIRHISAEELRELAGRYLRPNEMWQVVVGAA